MKRILGISLVLALVIAVASPVLAYPRAVEKFRDGAKDVATSPLIVKDNVMTETKDVKTHVLPIALVGGLLKGGFYMGEKIVHGTWAMVTSPLEMTK